MFSNFSFIDTDCLISWTRVKMRDTIELFIQYTTLTEPTTEGQVAQYQQLLRGIASGTWSFPVEFEHAW